jgi:hypothetical protein
MSGQTPHTPKSRFDALLVLILALFCYTFRLGNSPLAGTEGHRALTAHQMVQSGQWLLPKLFDQLYLKKPPLDYWIVASFESATHTANEFIWRLPSAIAAAILAATLCVAANRWFGRPAGLVAGLSHLMMIAVWEQSRTADIDSMNSLMSVLAALGLIEMAVATSSSVGMMLATGTAVGASLMVKGPAGLPVILGALIGPSLVRLFPLSLYPGGGPGWGFFSRRQEMHPHPSPPPEYRERGQAGVFKRSITLVIGITLFGIYALAAWHRCQVEHLRPDLSGLSEAVDKSQHFSDPLLILKALALPFVLWAYALPVSAALPLALHPAVWSDADDSRRRAVRALVGALAVGSAIAVLSGMSNPRYGYVLLPLLCPLAGAVVAAALREQYPAHANGLFAAILTAVAIGLLGVSIGVTIASWRSASRGDCEMMIIATIAAFIASVIAVEAIAHRRARRASIALAILVIVLTFPLSVNFSLDRSRRSAYPAAMRLAQIVPRGTLITTGQIAMNQPELFYYSGMSVESHPSDFALPLALPTSRWVILTDEEYAAWLKAPNNPFHLIEMLWPQRHNAFLGWYTAPAPNPAN